MNQQRPRRRNAQQQQQQRRPHNKRAGNDFWRTNGPMPDLEPIAVSNDVSALLRSLGDPPLPGVAAAGYFEAVIERSAAVAMALAFSADVLARDDD
jgi:hypothetical protein